MFAFPLTERRTMHDDCEAIAPARLDGPGVYEDTCWAIGGGFALKAIDASGQCVDFRIVRTCADYRRACVELWAALEVGVNPTVRVAALIRVASEPPARVMLVR